MHRFFGYDKTVPKSGLWTIVSFSFTASTLICIWVMIYTSVSIHQNRGDTSGFLQPRMSLAVVSLVGTFVSAFIAKCGYRNASGDKYSIL
jgi:hypothetical protein